METITLSQVNESLRKLPSDKLSVVYDFITFLVDRESTKVLREQSAPYAIETMLASEAVLSRDWNTPEEDEAWANL